MGRLFGTDGVRGVANTELTPELVYNLGRAGAHVLTKETHHAAKILVGMDTRISGDMLEAALIAGICSVGAHAFSVEVVPTPAVAYLVRKYNLDAGVMISASHNPVEYNGIKFFNNEGYKLRDDLEDEIEDVMFNKLDTLPRPEGKLVGNRVLVEEALDDYLAFLKTTVDVKFDGLTVALDCANGASYKVAPIIFSELNAETCVIHNEPDGLNINEKCGSTHMEDLMAFVKTSKAAVGFAFDGDADRCLCIDENGNLVDGDQMMAICANFLKQEGKLTNNTVVATVMSNLGFFQMAEKNDIHVAQTKVGDRYVLEKMIEDHYILGGEQSGHVIFLEHNTTGDGVLTALQILSIMKKTGKKLSELASCMEVLPQVLVNANVSNAKKDDYLLDDEIKKEMNLLDQQFSGEGRVLIRVSGTEPKIRVMIEGRNKEEMQKAAEKLAALMEERLK